MIDTVTKNYDGITNEFCGYQVTYVGTNRVKSVPLNEANADYQTILTWIADGGTVIDNGGGE